MSIRVGAIELPNPVLLAPMSGVSDRPFRCLAKRFGAGLVVSEMVASHAILHDVKSERQKAEIDSDDDIPVLQLAGWDPEMMAEAARMGEARGAAIIDINMGCPAKNVVNKAAGSALMRDEPLAFRIIEALVEAVKVPVTLKMRLGWDDLNRNAPVIAKRAEEIGVQLITIHGRTRCQMYKGQADWRAIREIKDSVSVPLIANGDICSIEDAKKCLEFSGADGVMIGRGAYGKPWIPGQIADALMGREVRAEPTGSALSAIMQEHLDAMLSHYGFHHGLRNARKHIGWYSQGLENSAEFRRTVNNTMDPEIVFGAIEGFFGQSPSPLPDRKAA